MKTLNSNEIHAISGGDNTLTANFSAEGIVLMGVGAIAGIPGGCIGIAAGVIVGNLIGTALGLNEYTLSAS